MKILFSKFEPRRQIKFKGIEFALSNKSIMANKPPSTSLELFLRRIKSPLKR